MEKLGALRPLVRISSHGQQVVIGPEGVPRTDDELMCEIFEALPFERMAASRNG